MHDTTVKIQGVLDFPKNHVERGIAFIIAEQVSHFSLVLENKIELDDVAGAPDIDTPQANPWFRWMVRFVFLEKAG